MISAITNNLQRGIKLLNSIDENQYTDVSVAPYYSSIGVHMRHILDVFDCVFIGLESNNVDLSARKRNALVEQKISLGLDYFSEIITKLEDLKAENLDIIVQVKDDLGLGVVTAMITFAYLIYADAPKITVSFMNIAFNDTMNRAIRPAAPPNKTMIAAVSDPLHAIEHESAARP